MSEPFAGDLGMYAARQQMRCVGVAQVVIANARQARLTYLANPFMGEAVRLDGPAIRLRHDESVVRDADAKAEKTLRLFNPVRPQLGGHHFRYCYRTGPAGLGRLI